MDHKLGPHAVSSVTILLFEKSFRVNTKYQHLELRFQTKAQANLQDHLLIYSSYKKTYFLLAKYSCGREDR